ncbi:cobyrinate a,c-diamide synthase [Siculibacillus lacustris]|uniref:Hydrogenobyrinate a,c-diamide synthase n=1 Tax=Siculibacillus lacustris TaxID=1549641 RepID=A0A4Q9VJ73_9HYPH|nr:cobyrinate a,c-diamide synthase [Siculibacillus lacustris]TBW35224.1 cobyrinate a,c-diamide synthase [Siculibacillus lacustris]
MTPPPAVPRGLLVAALRSGSGKTTVTLGLMRALARRGLAVSGAKCGPDYIDPAFHGAATGRPSLNLDSWAMPPALLAGLARQAAVGADLVVVEGLMGLLDGVGDTPGRSGASVDVARALGLPLVLVLDVSGQSQSAAAAVAGIRVLAPDLAIAGVILNRVGSERHVRLVTQAMTAIGVEVLGALPRRPDLVLPERHLGLVQAEETADLAAILDRLADFAEAHLAIDRVIACAAPLGAPDPSGGRPLPPPGARIAVARDAAFTFLYPHLLLGWRAAGAEIVPFSPLADEAPPDDCDVCWLPGGYPELHAGRLAAATGFRAGLARFAETRPVHGECGGYMVLGRTLTDAAGTVHPMAGLLDVATSFATRRMTLGYRSVELLADGILGRAGQRLAGHEFHYATVIDAGGDPPFALAADVHGGASVATGARRGRVTGSFFHVIAGA